MKSDRKNQFFGSETGVWIAHSCLTGFFRINPSRFNKVKIIYPISGRMNPMGFSGFFKKNFYL